MFRGVNGQTQIQFLKKENFLYFTFLGEKKKEKKEEKGAHVSSRIKYYSC